MNLIEFINIFEFKFLMKYFNITSIAQITATCESLRKFRFDVFVKNMKLRKLSKSKLVFSGVLRYYVTDAERNYITDIAGNSFALVTDRTPFVQNNRPSRASSEQLCCDRDVTDRRVRNGKSV